MSKTEATMKTFTSATLTRSPREVTLAAEREPVTITQHRKARYVLMTVDHYQELANRAHDPRQVYRTAELPEDLRENLIAALDNQILDEDRTDGD
jgi:PHD/YefM family antitoxin component YafN of YafNO toxin-antitoxin module